MDDFAEEWERLAKQAHAGSVLGGSYDDRLAAVVEACRLTKLVQFYPFTSLNRLCFARSRFPFNEIQPAHIEVFPDGRYFVSRGSPYPTDTTPPIELDTADPIAAVEAVTRLLAI